MSGPEAASIEARSEPAPCLALQTDRSVPSWRLRTSRTFAGALKASQARGQRVPVVSPASLSGGFWQRALPAPALRAG